MTIDLDLIKRLGEKNRDSNFRFRSLLKGQDSRKIDNIVHQLYQDYSSKIDCTKCGNCCTKLKPLIHKKDILVLAKIMNQSSIAFKSEYIMTDSDNDMFFKHLPCTFLKDNKCTIYDSRPLDCRSFPHLHKKEFISRLFGVIDYYSICPIVFNVFEDLKTKLYYR